MGAECETRCKAAARGALENFFEVRVAAPLEEVRRQFPSAEEQRALAEDLDTRRLEKDISRLQASVVQLAAGLLEEVETKVGDLRRWMNAEVARLYIAIEDGPSWSHLHRPFDASTGEALCSSECEASHVSTWEQAARATERARIAKEVFAQDDDQPLTPRVVEICKRFSARSPARLREALGTVFAGKADGC